MNDVIINHLRDKVSDIPADWAISLKPVSSLNEQAPFFALHPAGNTSAFNNHDNRVIQTETVRFAVFTVAKVCDLDGIRKDLKKALRGFQPDTGTGMIEHVEGNELDIQGSYIWYKDLFQYEKTSE